MGNIADKTDVRLYNLTMENTNMGMSASQGRLLMLTARRQDLELRGQTLTQRRLALQSASDEASQIYAQAVNNRHLFYRRTGDKTDLPRLTYAHVVNKYEDGGMGNRIKDSEGNVVVAKQSEVVEGSTDSYKVYPDILNPDVLENGLRNGAWYIEKPYMEIAGEIEYWEKMPLEKLASVSDELNLTDDAPAKARYDSLMQQIQSQDKSLDLEQKAVETEHKAISAEFESVQKIIMKNVEVSYKNFNA